MFFNIFPDLNLLKLFNIVCPTTKYFKEIYYTSQQIEV